MSKRDEARREVLEDKFPEMAEHFQELKEQANERKIERLGDTKKEQRTRS